MADTVTGPSYPDNVVCPCNEWSDFPRPCPYHTTQWTQPLSVPWAQTSTVTLSPSLEPWRLSDEDVERIAKRVAELVKPKRRRKRKGTSGH